MYGLVNKFVVRKTGLEVVESYLDIYARIELRLCDEGPLIA